MRKFKDAKNMSDCDIMDDADVLYSHVDDIAPVKAKAAKAAKK